MPERLPADLLVRVQAVLGDNPSGMALHELEKRLRGIVSRRSLQRKLLTWIRRGELRAEGVRRGRLYFAPPTLAPARAEPTTDLLEAALPVSTAGQEIRAQVRRPIADRAPVGYERSFLDQYIPNATQYLSNVLLRHLHELGHTRSEGSRPAGTYARDILSRLLIDLSWSSSRLEGNTYSLLDTQRLIERGTVAAGKDAKETQMILNHKAAIELLVTSADEVGVNRYTVTNLHALLADNLLDEPAYAGRLRETPIAISASTYIPTAVPQPIEEAFATLLEKAAAVRDPFEQSFFLMVQIPYLQPFVDVNKRTSRLAANISLIKQNLVPLSFIEVPESAYVDGLLGIYEQNRIELLRDVFIWAYERSSRHYKTVRDSLPEPDPFRLKYRDALIQFIGETVRSGLDPTGPEAHVLVGKLIPAPDREQFLSLAVAELGRLHEGNIARFRLRPGEFRKWSTRN